MSNKLLLTIGAVASIFCIACNPAPEEEPVLPEAEVDKTLQANLDRQVLISMCINGPYATTCVRLSPETETDGATKGFYIDQFTLRTL